MSSTLLIILSAAMGIPADGPEKLSAEMVHQPRPLDLSGDWEGRLWDSDSEDKGSWTVKLSDNWLVLERGTDTRRLLWQMSNEGRGKVKVRLLRTVYAGSYRQENGRVAIALGDGKSAGDIQSVLILNRAKPGSFRFLGIDPGMPDSAIAPK